MAIRPLDKLKEDQSALLASYRALAVSGPTSAGSDPLQLAGSPEGRPTLAVIAKVTSRILVDPDYGAHLVVQIQEFSGVPPAPSDAAIDELRAYPTPGNTIVNYPINSHVSLITVRGALLAAKLA